MDISRLLLRMARLARNPPSRRSVIIGAVAIAAALGLAGIEAMGLWPEGLGSRPVGRPQIQPLP